MTRKKKKTISKEDQELINEMSNRLPMENGFLDKIKIEVKCKSENQKKLIKSIKENDVTICSGPAGTGKSYLSCAETLSLLLNKETPFRKIVLVKSVTTLKDEEIGYLKGTLHEKLQPFMYSFIHNFEKIIGKGNVDKLQTMGLIEILPIAYMRGINIDNALIIVDEAQNISIDNCKTILTRLGNNSKMIFLGDMEQVDMKQKKESSLSVLLNKIKNNPNDNVGVVEFEDSDIVRHRLTSYFIELFKDTTPENNNKKQILKD